MSAQKETRHKAEQRAARVLGRLEREREQKAARDGADTAAPEARAGGAMPASEGFTQRSLVIDLVGRLARRKEPWWQAQGAQGQPLGSAAEALALLDLLRRSELPVPPDTQRWASRVLGVTLERVATYGRLVTLLRPYLEKRPSEQGR